jgi:hypothetical protein
MIHPPFSKGHLFEVSLYNKEVRALVKITKVTICSMIIGQIFKFMELLPVTPKRRGF